MKFWLRWNNKTSVEKSSDYRLLESSGFFDADWYLSTYPDVRDAGLDPLDHYIRSGAREGRNPGPDFDTIWYLSENYEVQAADINPLVHFLQNKGVALITPKPLCEAQRFESFNRAIRSGLLDGSTLYQRFRDISFGPKLTQSMGQSSALPLPPLELSARIGSPTLDGFEEIGRDAKLTITRCLPEGFSFDGARCLDFGCGIGRAIRHFEKEAESAEFWGCDIDGTSTQWCAENLTPPFRFFQLSDTPVLPFESSSFDLVYALAVFSQIFIDWQMLAMEIRRILKPNGLFFMSFNGQTSYEDLFQASYYDSVPPAGMYVDHPYQAWNKGGPNVALSPAWIQTHWGSIFDIDYIAMEGFMDYQSFCIMRKPAFGGAVASQAPVLRLGTSQAFHPNAAGRIGARLDPTRPFKESYGIVGTGTIDVHGWIVFRNDRPMSLELSVDGMPVLRSAAFSPAETAYRDWGTPHIHFSVDLDLSPFTAGLHDLAIRFESRQGSVHTLSMPLTVM